MFLLGLELSHSNTVQHIITCKILSEVCSFSYVEMIIKVADIILVKVFTSTGRNKIHQELGFSSFIIFWFIQLLWCDFYGDLITFASQCCSCLVNI